MRDQDQNRHQPEAAWGRPHYAPGGGDATVLYAVFGDFPQPLHLDAAAYRSAGLPVGVRLTADDRWDGQSSVETVCGGWLAHDLRDQHPALYDAVQNAPACLTLIGLVPDPPTLLYLRDLVGLVTALLDGGGVAVLDWQALAWWSPERWRERLFAPDALVPTQHVSILLSPEEGGDARLWVHTRGMRKFGRPDVSVHGVAPSEKDGFIGLCNRLINGMALGGIVPEGQEVRVAGLPTGTTCHHQGDFEDPDFNNVHIEVQPSQALSG